ncbi:unnamed protein product [Adineta steineri]|uniref:Uncharacterized protein n=1 Tax=Adineta steineri TaxID=433720 RepID=A0A818TM97_9BILA|nr:unnamed protein product [Adineta steineri]
MKNTQYLINFIKLFEIFSLNIAVHLLADNQYIKNLSSLEFQNDKIEGVGVDVGVETNSGAPVSRVAQNDGIMDIRLALSRIAHGPSLF